MTVNRHVSYFTGDAYVNSIMEGFGPTFDVGACITMVRVTAKLCFKPGTYTDSSDIETGVWAMALQVGLGGVVPDTWHVNATDPSILAFDSSDPDALARTFWAPDSDTVYLQGSGARTLTFQGQYKAAETANLYLTIIDTSGDANAFIPCFSWQIWYAT
jgi:hypothetical protein